MSKYVQIARKMQGMSWTSLEDVSKFCDFVNEAAAPGFECCVVRHKGETQYNVTHVERAVKNNYTILYPKAD